LGTALGHILRRIVEATGVGRVAVAGGDTSGYAARALQIEALEVVTPLAPGSPLCRVRSQNPAMNGVEALFKGGQVGRVNLFQSIQQGYL
jgi:uncharacterized protein YgbK (DUF1537 family)